jgi:RNA polymerase sigma-70 factor (ECF subfamily)
VEYSGLLGPAYLQQVVPDGNNLNDTLFKNLLDDDMSGAVAALKEDFRIIIILCDIEGMTYKETARFLGCPLGTVRSRLHRGRKLLHDRLYAYAIGRGYVRSAHSSVASLRLVAEG